MKFTFDELKLARERGYSDDEIWNTLASEDEEIGLAKQRGYSLEEVASITSGQPIPEGFAAQPAAPAPEATLAEGAEDIGRKFLMGGAGGIRAFTDLLGADNPISQSIAGIEDYIAEGLSAESKQDSQAISRLFQEVESKGLTDKFLAGLEAFKMAPAETLAQTAGYMIPNLAAGLAGKAAQLTRGGMMALQAGVGGAQGLGTAKGEIYQGSYDYLLEKGLPEDEARRGATEAQATFGKNLPQLLLSFGLGAAAASTGAERIITRMLTRTGKEVSERSIKDVIKGGLKGIAGEVPLETVQEGQEKVATNIALQNLGADVDTFAGVPQAVGMAVGPAAILGGVAGAVEVLTPEQQAERKIEKQSTQMARQLTVSPTDTTGKVIVDEITKKENAIDNLRSALSSIDPNTPEGQELSTAIKKAETELSTLKKQSGETVETEQARLAREIAAPVEPAPTAEVPAVTPAPVSETITPAEEAAPVTTPAPAEVVTPSPAAPTPAAPEVATAPTEYKGKVKREYESGLKAGETAMVKPTGVSQEAVSAMELDDMRKDVRAAKDKSAGNAMVRAYRHGKTQGRVNRNAPVFAEAVKAYGITLPEGYTKQGDLYVYQPAVAPAEAAPTIRKMAPVRVEEKATPVPEADRYTFDESSRRAITFFGGELPDGLIIVNDTTNPDYEMKAGYDPETGDIILNRAYIKKGESIEDILTHELGHYILSDPKFQADFKNFLESMPDDTRAEIEAIINQSYNKDTNQTQIEERQVMAFTALVKANKDTLSKWETIKNTIKRWINKIFGTNIKLSDEGAMAVFNVGFKRFKSGERIIRAMEEGTLRTAPEGMSKMDRDYLAAVERGDMETAQKMVDEAAKAAGYNVGPVYHGTKSGEFSQFDPSKIGDSFGGFSALGGGFFFTTNRNAAIRWGQKSRGEGQVRVISAYIKSENPVQATRKDYFTDGKIAELRREQNADSVVTQEYNYPETDVVVSAPSQIKSADPVTYDDAGNVIPLSQRFRATSPDIRRMAAEPRKPAAEEPIERYTDRGTIVGLAITAEKSTPKGIIQKTTDIIKKNVFDGDADVSNNNTKKAWNLIGGLVDSNDQSVENAEAINQLTRETMQDVRPPEGTSGEALKAFEVIKQTVGMPRLRNELFKYAIKLTAQGDKSMLDYLLNNELNLTGKSVRTKEDLGRFLGALRGLSSHLIVASEAEREGFFQMGAQQFFDTKNPTDEQIAQIRDMFNKVKQVKIDQVQALGGELGKVGQATGIDLPAVIDKQLENAPGLDPMIVAIQNMLRMGGTFIYRQFPSKVEQAVKQTISRGITNYRQKMVSKAATGLETGFWKTLSTQEDKPGPLGELDAAQNRELGNIVKSTLIGMGLKGTPPNTKMSIYEQVASILNEQPLKADKIKMADEKIRGGINSKRVAELENARNEDEVDAINHKYDQLEAAWDEAMSRQTDMPVSNAMLRRMIFAELKEEKSSIADLAKLMEEEPAIATSRMDRLVNSIIEKVTGITFEGQPTRDYTSLKTYLDGMLSDLVEKRQTDRRAAAEQSKIKRQAGGDPTKQAQAQIDKLAKIQADPTIFGETKIDPVRNAVRDALALQLNIGFTPEQTVDIKRNWKGAYVADPNQMGLPTSFMLEMQRLGVKEDAANTLAEIVWKQIEVNAMNRQMDSITKAVEAGPIGGMVQAILDTPLANQQDPEWRKQVIVDYLKNAGVKASQAENIAKLFDLSLRKRFAEAQEAAMEKAAKAIKGGLNPASKKAMEKFRKAIRAQVLDPGTDVAKAFGEQMGWTGFTKEQIVRLNELDAIVNDTTKTEAETFVAIEQINKIIDSVSAPPQVKDILASYYVGNILGRITTFTIQAIDPLAFTTFNAVVESFRNITNPAQFMSVWSNYGRGISNLIRETSFSFKNDVLRSGKIVDYMGRQDRQIGRLWDEAQKKWQRGDIKGAMKDGIFGYTAWTFRTLKALDDGAYSLLTTTTLPSYVDAALKRAKVPRDKRRGVMRGILEARELDIKNMVEQGTPRNDAIVFANEKMRGEITKVLTGMNIDAQEVIDSAINDALSRIGKTRFQEDIHGKETEIKDLGFISSPLLRFYEAVAKSVNEKGGSESQKIFYRILLGFPLIPARIFNIAAGYTPLTIYRHFLKNRYSLTYGTALQRRQRLVEQLAGTAAMLPLLFLRSNSLDEEDEAKKGFGIYITGQGPSRTMDRETRAQWDRRFDPYSLVVRAGGKSFSIDARASGPLAVMIYTFGAIDDWENRRKQEGLKTSKDDWRDVHEKASLFTAMYELAGSFALTTARRGPTTGVIQGLVDFRSYPDDPIAAIGKEVAFSGMPAVPILGTGVVKNLSDLFSQPIDNKTKEGAILANIPIVGTVAGQPALNAYGQRIGELRVSEKLKKSFGLPFTLIVGDSEDDTKLTSLTLKFGNGPTPIRREEIENAIKDVLSDEEWYLAAKTFGDGNRKKVLAGYERYNKMKPDRFNDAMNRIAADSKKAAIRAVRLKKSESR